MVNLANWPVLRKLNPQFVANIKFVSIFGENGNEVIIVTKEDKVFAFGDNRYGCLGLGIDTSITEPTIVDDLCGKQITNISYGYDFVISWTKTNAIYSWGNNIWGQLGTVSAINSYKPNLISELVGSTISDICCGGNHTLVLTESGEVYSWGLNNCGQIGNGNFNNQLTPIKLSGFSGEKVTAISCGGFNSLALTANGHVYSWGFNGNGELGIGNNINQNVPVRVNVENGLAIKKIACGLGHSLLLSAEDDVYCFGYNKFGQIGNGNHANQNVPVKIVALNRFTDVVSELRSNISIAMSQNGFCFVWGECNEEVLTTPKETPFASSEDIFAVFSKRKIAPKQIMFDTTPAPNRIIENLSNAFNDPKYSDIIFNVDSNYIYAHKLLLKICCRHFDTMLSKRWSDYETNEIKITQYSYPVYYAFLKYIYTDSVDCVKLEEVIDLLDLANSYLEEELKHKCVKIIKTGITVENVCVLFSAAIKYNLQELENFCFDYALNKFNDICKTDGFHHMDDNSCKKLIMRAASNMAFK